jgi:hypothetical protein
MNSELDDAPEVKQALAKAEECAKQAALAKTKKERPPFTGQDERNGASEQSKVPPVRIV